MQRLRWVLQRDMPLLLMRGCRLGHSVRLSKTLLPVRGGYLIISDPGPTDPASPPSSEGPDARTP